MDTTDPYAGRLFFSPPSKPLKGAIIRNLCEMDFTLYVYHYNLSSHCYDIQITLPIYHADRLTKVRGKRLKIGRNNNIWFVVDSIIG